MSKESNSRPGTAHIPPFGLRMQPELRESLQQAAVDNGRSLNAEIVARLEQSFQQGATTEARIERLEREMVAKKVDGAFKGLQAVTHAHTLIELVSMIEKASFPANHPIREQLALIKQTAEQTISRLSLDDALTENIDSLQGALVELRKLPRKD